MGLIVSNLFKGNFGPFKVRKPVQVPLWLAIVLRKGNNCTIVPPPWMSLSKQIISSLFTFTFSFFK